MKLTKEQKQVATENMQFYNKLLQKATEDPNFIEFSLRKAIFQRFNVGPAFHYIAQQFGKTAYELGYELPEDETIPLDHEKTVAILKRIVEKMQSIYNTIDNEIVEEENTTKE